MPGKWFVAAFGVLWTVLTAAMLWGGGFPAPPLVVRIIFPLFGVVFVVRALTMKDPREEIRDRAAGEGRPPEPPGSPDAGEFDLKCPNCGDAAQGSDVSPEGSAKCRSCGGWFKTRRGPAGPSRPDA